MFGKDEKESEQWEEQGVERLEEEKGIGDWGQVH